MFQWGFLLPGEKLFWEIFLQELCWELMEKNQQGARLGQEGEKKTRGWSELKKHVGAGSVWQYLVSPVPWRAGSRGSTRVQHSPARSEPLGLSIAFTPQPDRSSSGDVMKMDDPIPSPQCFGEGGNYPPHPGGMLCAPLRLAPITHLISTSLHVLFLLTPSCHCLVLPSAHQPTWHWLQTSPTRCGVSLLGVPIPGRVKYQWMQLKLFHWVLWEAHAVLLPPLTSSCESIFSATPGLSIRVPEGSCVRP